MFAYKKPLTETLVIEMNHTDALDLHGAIVSQRYSVDVSARLLSILEAFHAGTDMSNFEPPSDERFITNDEADAINADEWERSRTITPDPRPFTDTPLTPIKPIHRQINKPTFRNHPEEIDWTLRNHKEES